tara:strand:+ start:1663 stop:1956 length:294 start_codon:yes stop_codon:yes gene_type:complete
MAITKTIKADQVEVVNDWSIQVRTATIIKEDDVELTRSFHRHVLVPFVSSKADDNSWKHTATDISSEAANVQAIANAAWTDEVKDAYKTYAESQTNP